MAELIRKSAVEIVTLLRANLPPYVPRPESLP